MKKLLDLLCLRPAGAIGLLILLVLPFIPPFDQQYMIRWLVYAAILAAQGIAFDFSAGYINVVNFGFAAFVGLGAYTSALLVNLAGVSIWIAPFLGGALSGLLGFGLGIISLPVRGMFAACMAWFLGLALMGIAQKWVPLTGGAFGLRCPRFFDTASNLPYYFVIMAILLMAYVTMKWITRSHVGLAFRAIGQNMEAARTSGINPTHYRLINFTVSCAFAGLIGGFYAHYYGVLTPDLMSTAKTVEVLVIVYIGGRASLWGGVAAAFPFVVVMEFVRSYLSNLPGLNLIIYGLSLILVMLYYPGGFVYLYHSLRERYGRKEPASALAAAAGGGSGPGV